MLTPLIEQVPRESLEFTLGATRKAVLNRMSLIGPSPDSASQSVRHP
jgi:hypothetical protein